MPYECYHKEIFGAGIIVAYFTFAIITMFEEVIKNWLKRLVSLI